MMREQDMKLSEIIGKARKYLQEKLNQQNVKAIAASKTENEWWVGLQVVSARDAEKSLPTTYIVFLDENGAVQRYEQGEN